jgi:transcriptional regulator GlxA family with amidase domain
VARKTIFDGIEPGPGRRRHLVAIVTFDGVVLGDVATPCEIFGRARGADGEALYDVRVCSDVPTARSAHVSLAVPSGLAVLRRADTVIVPGLDDLHRPVPMALVRALRRAVDRGARVASICTGAFVLAQTGALDGRCATTHWAVADRLASRFPEIRVDPNVLYVDNGKLLTSAGAAAGLDLCLHLVRRDFGAATAGRVARAAVMPLERAGGQAQFIVRESPDIDHATFGPLLLWIERHLRDELSLASLARQAAMSTRTLSRRFQEHVGTTPGVWIARARVREAQRLLETTSLSIEEVAGATGFGAPTVLRERFNALVGTSPMAYRLAFRAHSPIRK